MPLAAARVHAPEFALGEWLNTPHPWRMADLCGHAALVDIWDFTCRNCLRTLPYLTAWQRAYRDLGVRFIGIHTPEFAFAKDKRQVAAALRHHHIEYPVLLDNDQRNWEAFANPCWPTVYLIDSNGYARYQHSGEGGYAETEAALVELVKEAAAQRGTGAALPRPVGVLREEDETGAVCYRAAPELHTGYYRRTLGNPEGYLPRPDGFVQWLAHAALTAPLPLQR